jgi:hypothetical protein
MSERACENLAYCRAYRHAISLLDDKNLKPKVARGLILKAMKRHARVAVIEAKQQAFRTEMNRRDGIRSLMRFPLTEV